MSAILRILIRPQSSEEKSRVSKPFSKLLPTHGRLQVIRPNDATAYLAHFVGERLMQTLGEVVAAPSNRPNGVLVDLRPSSLHAEQAFKAGPDSAPEWASVKGSRVYYRPLEMTVAQHVKNKYNEENGLDPQVYMLLE